MPGSALVEFNDSLEVQAFTSRIKETVIEHEIEALETIGSIWGHVYWLTLARINELALFCAANYAENCEFQGVGDFLVNPRLTLVHIRGMPEPVVKERHIGLQSNLVALREKGLGL